MLCCSDERYRAIMALLFSFTKACVVGTQERREVLLMSTHCLFFWKHRKILSGYRSRLDLDFDLSA